MKKSTYLIILSMIFTSFVYSQSTNRFIRIIGNSKKELKADKAKVYFSITEVKENTYNTTEGQAYDDVHEEVVSQFKEAGFNETTIKESIENLNRNYRSNSKEFFIVINYGDLKKISNINHPGFRIKETKYLYNPIYENLESELSLQAINDAKRKANIICDEIGKKVGKILNIEVKEGDFTSSSTESKKETMIESYKVTITF